MRKILLVLAFVSHVCMANVAVDEINHIISLKQQYAQTEPSFKSRQKDEFLADYDLIFIFRSTCPHCHKFSPVLKDFSDSFGMNVRAYSFDGPGIKEFESKPLTKELLQDLFLDAGIKTVVPALYLAHKKTSETYPLLFGEATPAQLAIRISSVVQKIKDSHDA